MFQMFFRITKTLCTKDQEVHVKPVFSILYPKCTTYVQFDTRSSENQTSK